MSSRIKHKSVTGPHKRLEPRTESWPLFSFSFLGSYSLVLLLTGHFSLLYLCIVQLLLLQPSHNQVQSLPIPHVLICPWPTQEQLLILISESQIQVSGIVSIWLALLGVSVELCSHQLWPGWAHKGHWRVLGSPLGQRSNRVHQASKSTGHRIYMCGSLEMPWW